MNEQEHVLTETRAARYVGVSPAVLRLWRSQTPAQGPRYFRAGSKLIRYRVHDLNEWIEQRLSAPAVMESR